MEVKRLNPITQEELEHIGRLFHDHSLHKLMEAERISAFKNLRMIQELKKQVEAYPASEAARMLTESFHHIRNLSEQFRHQDWLGGSIQRELLSIREATLESDASIAHSVRSLQVNLADVNQKIGSLAVLPDAVNAWVERERHAQEQFADIIKRQFFSINEAAVKANENIAHFIQSLHVSIADLKKHLDPLAVLPDAAMPWTERMAEVSTISHVVQKSLKDLERSAYERDWYFERGVMSRFRGMAEAYNSFWDNLRQTAYPVPDLNPVVLKVPSIELYQATALLKSFHGDERSIISKEAESSLDEARDSIESKLSSLDKRLVRLYLSAKKALSKRDLDHARHFAISLRELITHTLHMLAPDEEFHRWNTDPSLVHRGKPTRKGRLFYVLRNVKTGRFEQFVDADVKAAMKFLDLFQEGTHALESSFTDSQLLAMLGRAEALLSYLLDVGHHNQ